MPASELAGTSGLENQGAKVARTFQSVASTRSSFHCDLLMAFSNRRLQRRRGALRLSRAALQWGLIALAVRLVAALAIHAYSLAAGFGGFYPLESGHDDGFYFGAATLLWQGQDAGTLPSAYPAVLALLFKFTGGPDLLVGKLLNVFAGALTVYLGVLVVRALCRGRFVGRRRRRAMNWAGGLLTFYPSLLWYSTQLVKDPLLLLFAMWALYLTIRFLRRPQLFFALLWLAALVGMFAFRAYAALALMMALLLYVLRFRRIWIAPALLLAAVVPYAMGLGFFAWNFIQPWTDAEKLESFRQGVYSTGGSAAGVQISYANPAAFLATYAYSFATAMFGPFPWQISGAGQAIALLETVMIWPLIPTWLRGVRRLFRGRAKRRRFEVVLLIFSVVLLAMIALFSDNIGANTRLRLLPWCAFFLYASLYLKPIRFRARHRRRVFASTRDAVEAPRIAPDDEAPPKTRTPVVVADAARR